MKIYLNGKFVEKEQAKISVFDHGYLYGDGVFEGIRSYNCLVFKLSEHVGRLYDSAKSIMLNIQLTKKEMIKAVVDSLKINKIKDGYVRLVVSRGEGDLGLDPRKCKSHATIVIIADKITLYPDNLYRDGMDLMTVSTLRNIPQALNPQIKSLNYLNNILAKIEAVNNGYQEALMLNAFGYVAECTGDNIFIIKDNTLITPPAYMGVLKGITRQAVLDIALALGIKTKEEVFTRHDIFLSEECFLTGTAAEIIPVVKLDARVIGEGKPGVITKKILTAFKKLTKTDGVKYGL